jgi:hypothetical protein
MRFRCALFFLAVAASADAEWAILSSASEPGRGAAVHSHVVLEDSQTAQRATIDLALFSLNSCTLRVIDQPASPRSDLARVMAREKCLAGVNGGYFRPDYAPVGLLISDGRIIAPFQRVKLITGILAASARGVRILRAREFSRQQKFDAAIQCGPFLVDQGRSIRGLEKTRTARRTFAAIKHADLAALGFCSDVSLAELANILATAEIAVSFRIDRAINLDGGSSSGFWFARKDGSAFSISEQKPVRDFVAVVPR